PRPLASQQWWQTMRKSAYEFVGTIVAVAFLAAAAWLSVNLATRALITYAATPKADEIVATGTPPAANSTGAQPAPNIAQGPPAATTPKNFMTTSQLTSDGLLSVDPLGTVPPSALVLVFVLSIAMVAMLFVPRLFPEPIVNDSPQFKNALRIWVDGISIRRETPRAVKRFVNRLRFMAMRLREVERGAQQVGQFSPVNEPTLVTFASIEDLDED